MSYRRQCFSLSSRICLGAQVQASGCAESRSLTTDDRRQNSESTTSTERHEQNQAVLHVKERAPSETSRGIPSRVDKRLQELASHFLASGFWLFYFYFSQNVCAHHTLCSHILLSSSPLHRTFLTLSSLQLPVVSCGWDISLRCARPGSSRCSCRIWPPNLHYSPCYLNSRRYCSFYLDLAISNGLPVDIVLGAGHVPPYPG